MAIPNPFPNIADDVKSDVTTYSSNKIESLISAATELPIPAAGDEGKVLTVNAEATGYDLDVIPSELPVIGEGDDGKVLGVDSGDYALIPQVDPTDIIDDTASATTTVYSSDKVEDLLEPLTKTTATVTVHTDVTAGDVSDAVIARSGNVVIVRFESSIKAGTYTNLYNVTPVPSTKQLAVIDISGVTKTISVSTGGVIAFTQSTTFGSDGAIRGQIVYIV